MLHGSFCETAENERVEQVAAVLHVESAELAQGFE